MSFVLPDISDVTEAAECGVGLYVWSDTYGGWQCLLYGPDRAKVAHFAEHLALSGCCDVSPLLVDLPSLDRQSRIAMGIRLSAPVGARFIDSAPDGIIEPASVFDALCSAVSFEAQFANWRSEAFWQADGESITLDDALRLLFLDRVDMLERWLGDDPTGFVVRG